MGKGDRKTQKGKIKRKSFGKHRASNKNLRKKRKKLSKENNEIKIQLQNLQNYCQLYDTYCHMYDAYAKKEKNENNLLTLRRIREKKNELISIIEPLRQKNLHYSLEDIYKHFGRFEKFVRLELYPETNSYNEFGKEISGWFDFTRHQNKVLRKFIKQSNHRRSKGIVKFKLSGENSNFAEDNENEIQTINVEDIKLIYSFNTKEIDRYNDRYVELINSPSTIEIPIRDDGTDYRALIQNLYEKRLNGESHPLIEEEYHEYLAFKMLHEPSNLTEAEYHLCYHDNNVKIEFLKLKSERESLTIEEKEEFRSLLKMKCERRIELLKKEIGFSANKKLDEIIWSNHEKYCRAARIIAHFKPLNLSSYGAKYSVRLGVEGFLHIVIRHCREVQIGEQNYKRTQFRYKLWDVIEVLQSIVDLNQKEIDRALDKREDFQLIKGTAFKYDGNFYQIHIRKDGDVFSFFPHGK